jgi:ATP-binding protein involved in chromosome partitioning
MQEHAHQTPPQMTKEQQQARLDSIKKTWEQRRQISRQLGKIKTKIGVYSGKGGVGKTTVSVNLAVYLAHKGYTVGLLDADIDCPNVTKVMGMVNRPEYVEGRLNPAESYGVRVISMSFFQEKEDEAIIWRGPMVHNAINQFIQMTDWGDLDFLLVDLPPGTSDAPLTVMQVLSLDGFVMVTTPQNLAALDARRSINMVRKMNVDVLGIVENFSGEIFGSGAGEELAKELELPYLGSLELRAAYRDDSMPSVLAVPDIMNEYDNIWNRLKPVMSDGNKLPEQRDAAPAATPAPKEPAS